MANLKIWLKDESGQGLPEYGLIIGLVAMVVVTALLVLGPKISNFYSDTADKIANPTSQSNGNNGNHVNGNNGNHNGNN